MVGGSIRQRICSVSMSSDKRSYRTSSATIHIVEADITGLEVDAIVNAANKVLLLGGGVCGAIHRAARPEPTRACKPLAPCPTGQARLTPAFNLPAQYVIHTVGPVWQAEIRLRPNFSHPVTEIPFFWPSRTGCDPLPFPPFPQVFLVTPRIWPQILPYQPCVT